MAVSYLGGGQRHSPLFATVLSFLVLLLLATAQASWPTWLRLYGQPPDLTLVAVISLGLTAGGAAGLTAGLLGALIWASVADLPMGNLFISYMGLGFLAGMMRGRMFSDRLSMAMILAAAAVIVAAVVNLMLAPPPSPQSWIAVVFARSAYSALLTMVIYPLIRYLSQYYPEPEGL